MLNNLLELWATAPGQAVERGYITPFRAISARHDSYRDYRVSAITYSVRNDSTGLAMADLIA